MVNNYTSMALFLAQKMGLRDVVDECDCRVWHTTAEGLSEPFDPATNKAQLMDCILWARSQGISVSLGYYGAAAERLEEAEPHLVQCLSGEADIMRATVEAIAKAAGYQEAP